MNADVYLVRPSSTDPPFMTREVWQREEVTLAFLCAFARERWGADAFLLHDGGLHLGESDVTILLEATTDASRNAQTHLPEAPSPSNARAWQQAGWYARTLRWLSERLALLGETCTSTVTQVSTYDLGCVLHASTSGGGVYLKASETPHEARVTRRLAVSRPDLLPEVLAIDEGRNLLLTRDAGARLNEVDDIDAWGEAVTKLALLHREVAPEALDSLEAPEYEFMRLPALASRLLLDGAALRGWGLGDEVIASLAETVPKVEAAHRRVSALQLPLALTHGDAHPMNALVGSQRVVWFDWPEAGIAHPFVDAGWFFAWLSHPTRAGMPMRTRHPDAVERLWNLYLEALGEQEAADLLGDAITLALAHRAVMLHHRYWSWEGTVPGWRPQYAPYFLRWLQKHGTLTQN